MEWECLGCGSFRLCLSETSPLVVYKGGLTFPLCPNSWHGLKLIDALSELWVYCLFKVINKAYVTKSRDCYVNLKFSDKFLHRAITLAQGGELSPSGLPGSLGL